MTEQLASFQKLLEAEENLLTACGWIRSDQPYNRIGKFRWRHPFNAQPLFYHFDGTFYWWCQYDAITYVREELENQLWDQADNAHPSH